MQTELFMTSALLDYFSVYPAKDAPFMHEQLLEWEVEKPLLGLKVVHHVPVVENTLLKINQVKKPLLRLKSMGFVLLTI